MKVRDLMNALGKMDPELDVLCYSEDEVLVAPGCGFRILDIEAVDCTKAQKVRLKDGSPSLKFEGGPAAQRLAVLNVISQF